MEEKKYTHIKIYLANSKDSYSQYAINYGDCLEAGHFYEIAWRNPFTRDVTGVMRINKESHEVTYSEDNKPFERISARVELYKA